MFEVIGIDIQICYSQTDKVELCPDIFSHTDIYSDIPPFDRPVITCSASIPKTKHDALDVINFHFWDHYQLSCDCGESPDCKSNQTRNIVSRLRSLLRKPHTLTYQVAPREFNCIEFPIHSQNVKERWYFHFPYWESLNSRQIGEKRMLLWHRPK